MTIKIHTNPRYWVIIAVFYLLLFQNPLQSVSEVFSYIDEGIALLGLMLPLFQAFISGKFCFFKKEGKIVLFLFVFILSGLLGNLIYHYQPTVAVLVDLYTNLKFFLTVAAGGILLHRIDRWKGESGLSAHARFMAVIFFMLLLVDQKSHIFESTEMRYGLYVTQLFYSHPTYLAGAMVYLLSILTAFYQTKNIPYIGMCLCVLFFTLRGKAIAGAAAYCLIFYFIILHKKKLKLWHLVLMGVIALAVAGEQFAYYYLELQGQSARSALTMTSFKILKDYFPIGTGFGTYASAVASEYYSPVYLKYGLHNIHGLAVGNALFASDTFWPIVIGQTGLTGTGCFLIVIALLFFRVLRIRKVNMPAYAAGIFIFVYLMISSTSEPSFHNSIAIPLALLLGYILTREREMKKGERQ